MYDILYEGNNPPNTFDGLSAVNEDVSYDTLVFMFTEGRNLDNNYNIITRSGGVISYFYPAPPMNT